MVDGPDEPSTPDGRPKVMKSRGPVIVEKKHSRTDKILMFNDCLVKNKGPYDMKKMAEEMITTYKSGNFKKVDKLLEEAI